MFSCYLLEIFEILFNTRTSAPLPVSIEWALPANDDYILSNFSETQRSLVSFMPTISYFICPQLAWFSLSVKICMEWFIRLYNKTATAQSIGLGENKILILNFILSEILPYSWLLAEGVQNPLQASQELFHHLFPLIIYSSLWTCLLATSSWATELHSFISLFSFPKPFKRQCLFPAPALPKRIPSSSTWLKLLAYLWMALYFWPHLDLGLHKSNSYILI